MTRTMTSWDLFEDLREAQIELPQAARGRRRQPGPSCSAPASICPRPIRAMPR